MSKITKDDPRFVQTLSGFFHDLLRAAGISMTPVDSHDRIRQIGERMAESIEANAERKAVEVIKKLQVAVKEAFETMEADLEKVKNDVTLLETRIDHIKDKLNEDTTSGTD